MTSSRRDRFPIVSALAVLALGTAARAEVTGITYTRSSPFGAATFGSAGAYEQLDGVVTGEINPHHPLVQRLKYEGEEHFADWAQILFDQALLAEGGQLDDPAGFVKKLNSLVLTLSA